MVNALTPGTEGLLLHQALHGYSEGHRLLESSIPIPDDLKRLMLRMSDLSGTSLINGFQDYLTGYPLQSLNAYALARTWYAPEMARPGCVWTHTLIIPAAVMARIASLSAVRPLFRRPNGQSTGDVYSTPVPLDSEMAIPSCEGDSDQRIKMQAFMAAHYKKDLHPLIIAAANADENTDLIFAAWSQKWPSLRMSFTFCTGSLSARTLEKRPLDVQCVPTVSTRLVSREVAAAGFGAPILVEIATLDFPRWTVLAANDAVQCDGGPVRSFLWSVADVGSARADFESFVRIYDGLDRSQSLSNIVDLAAELFPGPTEGRRLKGAVLGDQKAASIPRVESNDILFALATTDHFESFDSEELCLTEQASRLLAKQPALGRQLVGKLLRASLNPIGDEILRSLILAMRPEDALVFAVDQQQFLPTLFRANPKLATSAQLWLAAADRKRGLFESLIVQPSIEPEIVRGIICALLDSGSDAFIGRAFAKWGSVAVSQALDWSEAHEGSMSESCRGPLALRVPDVMSWVETGREKSTPVLVAVAHVVAPHSSEITINDSTVWLRTLHALRESYPEDEANYISAFLLALALQNAPPAPLDLVSESFERVHHLAEKELLRDDAWFILQPLVPELSWGKNWDKCERMRRALMSAFVRHGWPACQLKDRIKHSDLVRQLLKSARKVNAEYYFENL